MSNPLIIIGLAALALIGAYFAGDRFGQTKGYGKAVAERAAADHKAQLQRDGDDAKLHNLSDYDLCVAGMRSNRMPDDACLVLRGDGEE